MAVVEDVRAQTDAPQGQLPRTVRKEGCQFAKYLFSKLRQGLG